MTEEKQKDIIVVNEMPKQEVTSIIDKEGKEYDLVTTEQALTEILQGIRKLTKGLL